MTDSIMERHERIEQAPDRLTRTALCHLSELLHLDSYSGDFRGVLVTYHTSEPELADVSHVWAFPAGFVLSEVG